MGEALGQQSRNSLGAVDLAGDVTAWDPNVNGSVVAMAGTLEQPYASGHGDMGDGRRPA